MSTTKQENKPKESTPKEPTPKEPAPISKEEELTSTLQRLQADFENYKKRAEKEAQEYKIHARAEMIEKILPLLDSFEIALKSHASPEEFRKGVELIYSQCYDFLKKEGVEPIQTNGMFDPYKHEVLLTQPTTEEQDDGKIAEELQRGYLLKGRVLRYAKVKVLKREDHGTKN